MNINYSFSNYLENRDLKEVAEYMTGDDANITIRDLDGRTYLASHKELGSILQFEHDWNLDSKKMGTTSFDKDVTHRGFRVSLPQKQDKYGKDMASDQSKLLGSYLAAITKFIKEYKPGTLDFGSLFSDVSGNRSEIIPLMQKSLKTIAMKNDMSFLNNKMLNKDALESLNRKTRVAGKGFTGIDDEKETQSGYRGSDKTEKQIRQDRMQNMMGKRSSIQQTKDFMSQQRSEYDAKKKARDERLAPKPSPAPEPAPKKSFLGRMFGS